MKINYKFRNSSADGFLIEYADKKFAQITPIAPKNSVLEIEFANSLGTKGNGFEIKLNLSYPGQKKPVHINAMSPHFQTSIDMAKDKLDLRIRKDKEKLLDRRSASEDYESE